MLNDPQTIDAYIALYPPKVQEILAAIRAIVHEAAPDVTERMSWKMPTFYLHGNLVHVAVHTKHIGFYPGASGVESFAEKIRPYKTSKGAIQFPLDQPIPYDLIREIVDYRVAQKRSEADDATKE